MFALTDRKGSSRKSQRRERPCLQPRLEDLEGRTLLSGAVLVFGPNVHLLKAEWWVYPDHESAIKHIDGNQHDPSPIIHNFIQMNNPARFYFDGNGTFAYVPSSVPSPSAMGNIYNSSMFPVSGTWQWSSDHTYIVYAGQSRSTPVGSSTVSISGTYNKIGTNVLQVDQIGVADAWAGQYQPSRVHVEELVYTVLVTPSSF